MLAFLCSHLVLTFVTIWFDNVNQNIIFIIKLFKLNGPQKRDHNKQLLIFTVITLSTFHCNCTKKKEFKFITYVKSPMFYLTNFFCIMQIHERRLQML